MTSSFRHPLNNPATESLMRGDGEHVQFAPDENDFAKVTAVTAVTGGQLIQYIEQTCTGPTNATPVDASNPGTGEALVPSAFGTVAVDGLVILHKIPSIDQVLASPVQSDSRRPFWSTRGFNWAFDTVTIPSMSNGGISVTRVVNTPPVPPGIGVRIDVKGCCEYFVWGLPLSIASGRVVAVANLAFGFVDGFGAFRPTSGEVVLSLQITPAGFFGMSSIFGPTYSSGVLFGFSGGHSDSPPVQFGWRLQIDVTNQSPSPVSVSAVLGNPAGGNDVYFQQVS